MRGLLPMLLPCAFAFEVSRPLLHVRHSGAARCTAPQLVADAALDDGAVASAQAALLAEVSKPQRSLAAIAAHVATLEAAPPPSKAKKAVQGDWKLTFASDEVAVEPFTTGAASGPFSVLEEVYHRMLSSDMVQSIEVVRKIGPFGNSARSLCGRFSVEGGDAKRGSGSSKGGGGKAGKASKGAAKGAAKGNVAASTPTAAPKLSWKSTFMIDERGREVDPPKECSVARRAVVTHVSPQLLVMRVAQGGAEPTGASPSYCVFTKMAKGALKKELDDEYSVYGVDAQLSLS